MQYSVTGTTIVANTGEVRGYTEERKEERAILKERRARAKPRRPGSMGSSTQSANNARDTGLIPGSGSSPGTGNGNPFQSSCLGNSMDRWAWWVIVHGVAKSRTRLSYWAHPQSTMDEGARESQPWVRPGQVKMGLIRDPQTCSFLCSLSLWVVFFMVPWSQKKYMELIQFHVLNSWV